jgi:serine/threonine-protein kinase
MPLAVGQKYAGYTILRELGAGGWGLSIWPSIRGCRVMTQCVLPAALTVNDEYRLRFNREADIAAHCGIRISLKSTIAESWTADCGSRWIT